MILKINSPEKKTKRKRKKIKGGFREALVISRRPLSWNGSGFEQEKMLRKTQWDSRYCDHTTLPVYL